MADTSRIVPTGDARTMVSLSMNRRRKSEEAEHEHISPEIAWTLVNLSFSSHALGSP